MVSGSLSLAIEPYILFIKQGSYDAIFLRVVNSLRCMYIQQQLYLVQVNILRAVSISALKYVKS